MNIKNPRCNWAYVVVSDFSILDVPPLRGNPFDSRPIERTNAHEIVGRQDILIRWKEHMHSQSPRLLLLVGDRGSGRTSLINAISSQTDRHFVGYYWNKEDPLNRVLDEIAVTFCGHEIPHTMHQKVERIVETLDSRNGPLPLIAFDYPSEVDISSFLSLILPILQRLRALVVVSLTEPQLLSLENSVKEIFEPPNYIEPLSSDEIQSLCDNRIRRMAREKWTLKRELLDSISSRTGGNPRSVVSILRDLIDEKRGLGSFGTLHSLTQWEAGESISQKHEKKHEKALELDVELEIDRKEIKETEKDEFESVYDFGMNMLQESEKEEFLPGDDDPEWGQEPEDAWGDEEDITQEEENAQEPEGRETITGWSTGDGTLLEIDEGTEPPRKNNSGGGLSGLAFRSKIATDEMPEGPDYSTPIQEPEPIMPPINNQKFLDSENSFNFKEDIGKNKISITPDSPSEDKRVFHSEGELWTVDPDLEGTLPEPSQEEMSDIEADNDFADSESTHTQVEASKKVTIPEPVWQSGPDPVESHIRSLNEAERLVVSIAGVREISPSDAEIQARLEVGRPRLSQIYNSLHKSGILSVRKEGRSRLFKLSQAASNLLGEA